MSSLLTPTVLGRNIEICTSGLTLTGTVLHYAHANALVLDTEDGESDERLTTNLSSYGYVPAPDEVFVKDWSEGQGVAQSLIDAGLAEKVEELHVGPFQSRAFRLRLIPQS